ncbi:DNA polymerase [Thiobaca trueperi]|uniref:Type-4 uracil-DNA glycosylase n=2 Tax=Thiobaca trueperi TaxID=127458 RepID=A0A4R3N234_9GAMM|nr:DNA polymerase [Thiobaca trueperi]
MDDARRRGYLDALGVTIWERRAPLAAVADQIEIAPVAPEPISPPLPSPPEPVQTKLERLPLPSREGAGGRGAERLPPIEIEPDPMPFDRFDESGCSPALLDAWDAIAHLPPASDRPGNAIERMDWETLEATVTGCRACGLCATRTRTVFGVGRRDADLMIIGEAPGADEDREGEPFVGRAGQLLTRMLAAIGFSREQVYIANVLKCRPPGNRDPHADEVLHCEGYLLRQVALVQPRVILAAGRIAAQQLLKTDVTVGRLRGRWFSFGPSAIPLRVTYHPAYLLRSPDQKAKAWEDLTRIRRRLDGADA